MPELYIITGSNGAGKSSVGFQYIPLKFRKGHSVFDGDKLFVLKQKELWDNGLKMPKEAKKIALAFVQGKFEQLLDEALKERKSFAYEGHFTNEAAWDVPKRLKDAGYTITIIFLGLKDTKLSVSRVLDRVKYGGHFVDRKTVENNFFGNLEKLNLHFAIADQLTIVDASEADHVILANYKNGTVTSALPFEELPYWFKNNLPSLADKIRNKESVNPSYKR